MDPRSSGAPSAAGVLPERVVVRLLMVLAAASGCLDAVCVAGLGGAFASVVTGNVVQLGVGIATSNGELAVGVATAVAGYALGVAAGSAGLGRRGAAWSGRTSVIVVAELAMLLGVAAGWLATDGRPGRGVAWLLLAVAAAAMGVQSAVTVSSGVPGASTTYLTGTVTNLVRTLVLEPRRFGAVAGGAGRLAALLCGAVAGGLMLWAVPSWAAALPAVLVGAVVATAVAYSRSTAARATS